jgi:hypothetical protein
LGQCFGWLIAKEYVYVAAHYFFSFGTQMVFGGGYGSDWHGHSCIEGCHGGWWLVGGVIYFCAAKTTRAVAMPKGK